MPSATTPAGGVAATAAALGAAGLARGGFAVNHMDVAPRHAGALMALSNTAGTVAGVVGVSATGWMLQAAGDDARRGWRAACGVAAAAVAGAGALFAVCARGERLFGETVEY
jgi:ACS family sodium-dependent inorganic phosphate cotransporter